jgi:hypothetical protein
VLGVAAIASSIARPPDRGGDETASDRAAAPVAGKPTRKSPQPTTIEFEPGAKPRTLELEVGQPATVLVAVETPGEVDIPSLGLTEPAEPLTPALFELLVTEAGSHPIVVQPAASETLRSRIATLKVVPGS